MYQYILCMYWYQHFRRVSSRVSGFQMCHVTGNIRVTACQPELAGPRKLEVHLKFKLTAPGPGLAAERPP